MRVLVTGGAGYIGSHVVRALARRGHRVLVYDNLSTGYSSFADGFDFMLGDMGDVNMMAQALCGVDAVMHFAAHSCVGESVQSPRKYFENNIRSALSFLNSLLDSNVKTLIFSSSCAVYGVPPRVPIEEDMPLRPTSPYGVSKLCFEHALEAYANAYALRYVSLRYFNAAGADEGGEVGESHHPETHLIPCALRAAAGLQPELQLYGSDYPTPDGTCIRDYIHVSDLAEAHLRALEYLVSGGQSTSLNLGTGAGHSVREVISMVENVTGSPISIRRCSRRAGDPPSLVADPSRAKKLLNWDTLCSLRQMVETAWNWLQRSEHLAAARAREEMLQNLSTIVSDPNTNLHKNTAGGGLQQSVIFPEPGTLATSLDIPLAEQ